MISINHASGENIVQQPGHPRPSSNTDTTVPSLRAYTDVESASRSVKADTDPFAFRGAYKSNEELTELRKRQKGRRLEKYHREQNNLIDALLKSMDEHTEEARVEEETARIPVKIAVWASLIANLSLCILQMYAAVSSLSLSLLATGIDSVFDLGSNVLLFWLHKKAEKLDHNKWPVGGARLETIGNIVYGFLMGSVNLVVIVESARTLITHKSSDDNTNALHVPSLIAVGAALGVKFLLFLYCLSLRKASSQVHILWEDHRNDLFINGFGLLMSAGGSKWRWFLDPMGAIIIAAGVIIAWSRTIYRQFELLAGKSAPYDFLQLLIYKVMTYSADIEKVDTVRAYHSGPDYFVEIDVVMDANTPLWKAHDLSQDLQDKIEVLPNVGRAFVHVDHETTHAPEHRKFV
ncbi:Metal tolerance protein 7 [Grifola frondosa]|uniref:Metal tolerance protein 7 n=1 Tax=Grifola frondosa TaxID=5627 RepID=A0A1C7MQV4_GRIFR|nr:Metal tolerance protein 7 [Grifola frondosa]